MLLLSTFSDAFASYAEYEDGTELTDAELEKIDVNSIIHITNIHGNITNIRRHDTSIIFVIASMESVQS